MANVSIWSGVGVAIESARGTAQALATPFISQAATGVLTSTGTTLANGDYYLLQTTGMGQVNNRVFRAANKATNTVDLEGEITTNYDACTAGNAYKVTFGTSISTLVSVSATGGDFDMIPTTTIHDLYKSQIPGQSSAKVFTFDSIWDVADAGLKALATASANKTQLCVKLAFANGQKLVFSGYVGADLSPGGNAGEKVTTPVVITAYGRPTAYAT